jgi:hypothetical protein
MRVGMDNVTRPSNRDTRKDMRLACAVRRKVTSTGGDPGSIGIYPLVIMGRRMPVQAACRKPDCGRRPSAVQFTAAP